MVSIVDANESVIKEQVRGMEQKKGFEGRGLNVTAKRKEVGRCCTCLSSVANPSDRQLSVLLLVPTRSLYNNINMWFFHPDIHFK